jgi:cell division septum initiation protein DivIVA
LEQFSYVKRGYNPEEVDKYVATLEQVIKSYKDKDNAIKNAIISAQIAADNVMMNAQMQAEAYKEKIVKQLQVVKDSVERQRVRVQAFQDVYTGLLRKYLRELDDSDISDIYTKLDDMDRILESLSEMDMIPKEPQKDN